MIPLFLANPGETNRILKINGKDKVRQHLSELGFVVGENITVISKIGENMILSIKDSRIGLDKSLTSRIMI